jgi:hypothetical protein
MASIAPTLSSSGIPDEFEGRGDACHRPALASRRATHCRLTFAPMGQAHAPTDFPLKDGDLYTFSFQVRFTLLQTGGGAWTAQRWG